MSILLEKLNKEELLKAIANDALESFALAKRYVEKYKEPPEELVRGLTKTHFQSWSGRMHNFSVTYAMLAFDHGIKVPDYVMESILENEYDAYDYLVKMIKEKRIIPDNFLNTYFEKHYSPPEALTIIPIMGEDYTYSKDVEMWYNYAENLLHKNLEIPENIINAVSKSIYYSERLIEHLLYKKRNVPEILVKSVSLSPKYSYYSVVHFTEYGKEAPKILNKSITKDPAILDMYDEFLSKRKERKKINESVIINEKLDKDELKQAFLKSPNTVFNYVKKHFLSKNENPPEEFINAIAQSSYTSKKYIDIIIHTESKAPKILIQRIIQDGDMSLNLLRAKYNVYNNDFDSDFPDLESISDQDLLKSITKESHLSFGAYQIYKGKGIKIPLNLWKSILSSPTASLYVARELLQNNEPIPEVVIKRVASKVENAFAFAFDLLKERMDLPETLLKTLAENPDMARIEHNFDNLIITYAELGKEIPDILIDGAANKKWRDTDLSNLCLKFASKGLKIPDKILDIFIEKTPKYGVVKHLGKVSYDILNKYIEYAPWNLIYRADKEAFKTIPSKLYQYAIDPDIAGVSRTKNLITGFLTNFNKIPEDFKQTIIDNYKEFGHKIPKDIADAAGIKQPETINEKLDKDELMKVFVGIDKKAMVYSAENLLKLKKEIPKYFIDLVKDDPAFSNALAQKMLEFNKKIPYELLETIAKSQWPPYYFALKCLELNKKIPEIILKSIARNPGTSVSLVDKYFGYRDKKIPDIIIKAVARNAWQSYNFIHAILRDEEERGSREEIPQIIIDSIVDANTDPHVAFSVKELFQRYNKKIPENIAKLFAKKLVNYKPEPIEEKLDKEELLDAVFGSWTDARSMIFDLSKMGKEIPDKLAILAVENMPASILTFVATDIINFGENKVPEIILKGISKNKERTKQIAMVYKNYNRKIPKIIMDALNPKQKEFYNSDLIAPKKTIEEKLDKNELLRVIQKDYDAYIDIMNHYFWKKEEYPPEEFLKMATETDEASRIFAEYCLEHKKDIPDDVIKKVAENPRSAYTIAALMILEERKVPEILIKSIHSDPLSLKQFREFAKNEESRFHIPTSYYAKI